MKGFGSWKRRKKGKRLLNRSVVARKALAINEAKKMRYYSIIRESSVNIFFQLGQLRVSQIKRIHIE